MNDLIGNNYEPTQEQLNAKKWMKIVGVILVILLLVSIGLIVLMYYMEASELKISVDTKKNTNLQNVLKIQEDGKIYIPIREFAKYVNYESYSGDNKGEDASKCYVSCGNETAYFEVNSDKLYKQLSNASDYEYFTIDEPVKMIGEDLYTTVDGATKAFNISFNYDKKQNKIEIYTLPYLVSYWSNKFTNSALVGENVSFSNQKALLYGMIIVKNANNYYGVYDLSNKEVLGTKYASIEFIESTKEFIITTAEKKMGIVSYDATTKISPDYDDIKQIDKDAGLYLVTNNKKQGVINNSGSIIVYLEYDQIGIDTSKYTNVDIKNQYLLYDKLIPVKRDGKWGAFDKTGKKILELQYDDVGCTAGVPTTVTQSKVVKANNVLLIPNYEGIVVKQGERYGLKDSKGEQLLPIVLQSIYSTTSAGKEIYYMSYNNQEINVIDYIKQHVIKDENSNNNTENNNEQNNNQTNTVSNNVQNNNVENNDNNTIKNEVNNANVVQ